MNHEYYFQTLSCYLRHFRRNPSCCSYQVEGREQQVYSTLNSTEKWAVFTWDSVQLFVLHMPFAQMLKIEYS